MSALEIPCPLFDLEKTLGSGQVFHWTKLEQRFQGVIHREPVEIEQIGDHLRIHRGDPETICHYFSLDHPLEEIARSFPADLPLAAATDFCRGLRLIRQPRWECIATFITSALKQVPHIRQISLDLRRRHGEQVGPEVFAYPTAATLAGVGESILRESRLGFRAKNLAAAARFIAEGRIDLDSIGSLPTGELERELCRLPGVGPKVARCVLLFAYERLDAFPIDVWIERVLRERYFPRRRNITALRLRAFTASYFGPYAGYAQQYLFHHARLTMGRRVAS